MINLKEWPLLQKPRVHKRKQCPFWDESNDIRHKVLQLFGSPGLMRQGVPEFNCQNLSKIHSEKGNYRDLDPIQDTVGCTHTYVHTYIHTLPHCMSMYNEIYEWYVCIINS
jgi:hypothetical protein